MTSGPGALYRYVATCGCVLLHLAFTGCDGNSLAPEAVTVPPQTTASAIAAPETLVQETPEAVQKSLTPPTTLVAGLPSPVQPERFRLPDDRPTLDRDDLQAQGLQIVESKHLILVTDLPIESVADLPPLADALFETLERRLGKLAPDVPGKPFQVTGFLMEARDRFERADVLPPEQYPIRHGRNLGYRFWMNNQTADYYRRHLMLHEFVHCFLMCEYGMLDIPPLWYTEGIAEYFATHQLHTNIAATRFGILPPLVEGFEGWHRITEIRRNFSLNPSETANLADFVPLQTVLYPPDSRFVDDLQYANAWALVWLINHHPELQPRFAAVAACRTRQQFEDALADIPEPTWRQLDQIWPLYLDGLKEADVATVRFPAVGVMTAQELKNDVSLPIEFVLDAGQQWVSTGLQLTTGQKIVIECQGRYVVQETTRPWFSEPDGITIDYIRGCPLGEVIGAIISADGTRSTRRISIGTTEHLRSPIDGTLWLQINDEWSQRDDNQGTVIVRLSSEAEY